VIHVHVTHEAVRKVGGIGAVLQGLVTAKTYRAAVDRIILVGPLVDRHRRDPLGPEIMSWERVVEDNCSPP